MDAQTGEEADPKQDSTPEESNPITGTSDDELPFSTKDAGGISDSDFIENIINNPDPDKISKETNRLLRMLACERIYNEIFGIQTELLSELKDRGEGEAKQNDLRRFYERFLELSESTATSKSYFGFLVGQMLISITGEREDRNVKITEVGTRFLRYIKEQYHSHYEYKPL